MKFVLSLLLATLVSCQAIAQEANNLSADSYEVYSALLLQQYGSLLKGKSTLLISAHTVPAFQSHDPVEETCRGRIAHDVVLKRLIDDLVLEKRRFRIDSKLKLEGNFKIVSGRVNVEEGREPGVIYLSTVAFSENKQVAMVWMSNSCGSLCGTGYLWVLNKQQGGWHADNQRLNCGFIR